MPLMVKIADLKDMALEIEVEHADMKVHFEALTKEGYDREIWRYKLTPLYDIMHAHWLKEEELLIPFWPECCLSVRRTVFPTVTLPCLVKHLSLETHL